jgi:hypothetical protein
MPGREFDPHELPNELFCVGGIVPENPGRSIPRLERLWVVPIQPFFLNSCFLNSSQESNLSDSNHHFGLDKLGVSSEAIWLDSGNFPLDYPFA